MLVLLIVLPVVEIKNVDLMMDVEESVVFVPTTDIVQTMVIAENSPVLLVTLLVVCSWVLVSSSSLVVPFTFTNKEVLLTKDLTKL